ncbi:MAG: FtsX-like permease family protein [Balneolaceae bacterium]
MLLSISWRNIWRHPGRSGVLLGAIIAGLWAGISVSSLTNGMLEQRFTNMIQEELTHAQIHHPDFPVEREAGMYINPAEEIFAFLENDERVRMFTGRTLVDGMIQSPLTTAGVQIRGIMTDRERETTTFHENLIEGEYLKAETRNPILLGRRLAEKLNVGIGNRIVLTFQDIDNELTSGSFTITGIYRSASGPYDERNVFVRSEDLSTLIAGRQIFHEIALMLHDEEQSDAVTEELNRHFDGIHAQTWYELSPELRYLTDFGNSMTIYVMIVIMLALAFGILNTMLMVIFERMRELGMLLAIGMNKLRVFTMVMLESVILTLTGAAVGMLLAYVSVDYFADNGLDLSAVGGESLAEFGYDPLIYPFVTTYDFIVVTILVVVTAVLAAVYPAIKALRVNPAEVVKEK